MRQKLVTMIKTKMFLINPIMVSKNKLLQVIQLDLVKAVSNKLVNKIQTEVHLKKKRKKRKNQNIKKVISLIH